MEKKQFERDIVFYGYDFWDFYNDLDQKTKDKINWMLGLIRDLERIPKKYFKYLSGTTLYEIRISSGGNIYRIFSFFDEAGSLIIINGFQKKSRKTPKRELERATKIKRIYFNEKGK